MATLESCVNCGSASARLLEVCEPNISIEKTQYMVWRCTKCGLGRISPTPSPVQLERAYALTPTPAGANKVSEADGRSGMRLLWRRLSRRDSIVGFVSGPTIADVGCNTGDLLAELRDRGFSVTGYERNPAAIVIARERGLDVVECDVANLALPPNTYDSITLSHVLEHVLDPVDVLRRCVAGLREGGRLIVQVPNLNSPARFVFGKHWHGWDVPMHLWHFNPRTLGGVIRKSGFADVRIHGHGSPEDWTRSIWKLRGKQSRLLLLRALLLLPVVIMEKFGLFSTISAVAVKKDSNSPSRKDPN